MPSPATASAPLRIVVAPQFLSYRDIGRLLAVSKVLHKKLMPALWPPFTDETWEQYERRWAVLQRDNPFPRVQRKIQHILGEFPENDA